MVITIHYSPSRCFIEQESHSRAGLLIRVSPITISFHIRKGWVLSIWRFWTDLSSLISVLNVVSR